MNAMLSPAFQDQLQDTFAFLKQAKLLIATSGGLDSMVLCQLCIDTGLEVALAHCNFSLRGEESNEDAAFVATFAQQHQLTFHLKEFDTSAFAKEKQLSIQMAARKLRYDWFQTIASAHQYDYILTGHHASDDLETFLINLSRGTGVEGLTGIKVQYKSVVRPLLTFSRKQIENYAKEQNLKWREDSSNASDAYMRNHLRHHAIPALEEANANFTRGFQKTQQYLKQSAALLKVYEGQLRQEFTYPINSILGPTGWGIDLNKLSTHKTPNAVLYSLLKDCHFTAWDDIYALPESQTGKRVFSLTHSVLKDREALQVFPIDNIIDVSYDWEISEKIIEGAFGRLELGDIAGFEKVTKNEIIIDGKMLEFPLTIRRRKDGDFFYPMGLIGRKKLSKYFKDEKVSLAAKDYIWLLCSGEDIVWVMGYRADHRYRITDKTTQFLKITLTNETT